MKNCLGTEYNYQILMKNVHIPGVYEQKLPIFNKTPGVDEQKLLIFDKTPGVDEQKLRDSDKTPGGMASFLMRSG